MPVYEYKAINSKGRTVRGHAEGSTAVDARTRLRKNGIFVTELVESSEAAQGQSRSISFGASVSTDELAMATRQLATLINSGVTLVESLTALTEQVENVKLKHALSDVRSRVNEGSTLGDALASHPKVFSNLFINMIRAGEASGALDQVLERLADFTENQNELKGKIKSAMAYPAVMISVGLIAIFIIFLAVIPKMVEMYSNLGQELPLPTQILIGISNVVQAYWYMIILFVGVGIFGALKFAKTEKGQWFVDRYSLKIPVFGPMIRMIAIARFSNTLATLLQSGVSILMALDIVKNIVNNKVLEEVIDDVRRNLSEGDSISEPLRRSGHFPPLVTHMIAVGEKTGEVESMLEKIAYSYKSQVDRQVSTLMSLIEPLMIVGLAGVIGMIVTAVMLPIMQMNEALG